MTPMSERGRTQSRLSAVVIQVAVVCVALAACTSNATPGASPSPTPPIDSSAVTAKPTQRLDDGVLRIGVLLPSSGEGASIGQSARAAVRVAVERANDAGGVNDRPVELVIRDEGADATTAALGLQQMIDARVDAIIGPASSNNAIALASTMINADIVSCSPSASTLALDSLPSRSLLFRTIASDSLEAEAMAEAIEQTGEDTAAITFVDDAYGRPLAQALRVALQRRNLKVTAFSGFAVDDDDFGSEASKLLSSGSGALALIGDPSAGSRMLVALSDAAGAQPRDIVVNDALRRPMSISVLGSISPAARSKIVGVSQAVVTPSGDLLDAIGALTNQKATGLFATQAYDCANLLMLGALQGGSTTADVIASQVRTVSAGGSVCDTFVTCASLLADGRSIDYDGPGGLLQLGATGDPDMAKFDEFTFDASGRDVTTRSVTVTDRSR
jgi:branched-chain amino acid transport system substrate-binding protein